MNTYALLIICVILTVGLAIGLAMCGDWEGAIEDCDNLPIPEQKPMCLNIINNLRGAETPQADSGAAPVVDGNPRSVPTTEQADSTPDTPTTTEQADVSVVRSDPKPCSRPLSIANVEVLKKPTRVYLTIRNNSNGFQSLKGIILRLSDKDGNTKHKRGFPNISITYQKRRGETHADSYIVLYRWRRALENHVRQPQEKVVALMPVDYEDGDVFSLMCEDTEISRYPEPVSASPQKHTRLTTLWANMKR